MATDRLIHEVKTGDVPQIDAGNFFWRPVQRASTLHARAPNAEAKAAQKPIAQQLLERPDLKTPEALKDGFFPLNKLEDRTFAGTGYNTIWRPRSQKPLEDADKQVPGREPDVLELNLTAETQTFTKNLGDVPNRGVSSQADISLKGISYVQRVGAFEDPLSGKGDFNDPVGIHFEPGVFMFVPASKDQPATINRMASIPHGTTINAQGLVSNIKHFARKVEREDIPDVSIIPFDVGKPNSLIKGFPQLTFASSGENSRLPGSLDLFKKNGTITETVFTDPNEILRQALTGQEIVSFATFDLSTEATRNPDPKAPAAAGETIIGGGTSNIGFLQGVDKFEKDKLDKDKLEKVPSISIALGNAGNAHAVKMSVRYWIETVAATLTIKPKSSDPSDPQEFRMISAAGVLGPTYFIAASATAKLTAPFQKKVFWTQIQYSQNVTLNFSKLSWPHISVATLGDTSRIDLEKV